MIQNLNKIERQRRIKEYILRDPFLSDKKLAELFNFSVQTIRLDRLEMGIPEMRKRIIKVAKETSLADQVKSLKRDEIIGELIDIELGKSGIAILKTVKSMAFNRTGIIRSHYIFSLADSLAISIIDAKVALTGIARLRYKIPVYTGQTLVAKARVAQKKGNKYLVSVHVKSNHEEVFTGKLVIFSFNDKVKKKEV
ncbi:MAG: transcription factor FapR [Candidatus Infernicultor aquiphilus]|nr:transcription factor FapR [bacterium]PIU25409.1 MAG: transcription factor FapR [Candidatus Atribacteria bacterium CG08_land_8_20_14_0_20_33_29]PIW11628.1 MAG: transcription factor FapR [Candidatus Atribacteria bacterium CG17_big_fil_post_rev_8_21_14_2_50_34_11]PIX34770.1 MAG: transcription factor FapR [Candidatus Atribacteria bacterium CG_4_8_14_3_um_filter_34_18]PIY33599.1 MAG: transcription factor FapR [Candidatus Atribacteria bacterium CG_4_10_14_3_um_filter_34_13]PJB55578.1 MAG: transcr